MTRNRAVSLAAIAAAVAFAAIGARAQSAHPASGAVAVAGLDHIPIAVNDLEDAGARFRALGFTLKPGTPHENGIRNLHAKFPNGTELELITAPAPRDPLTATYRRHLAHGDGPAFLAFYAPDMNGAARRLEAAHLAYRRGGALLDLMGPGRLTYIFFGPRNASPTDRPEHFAHANSAESLVAVWLAGADLANERRLLRALHVPIGRRAVDVPDTVQADVARLPEGRVVLLPPDRALVPGRPIVGATLRVRSLAAARAAFAATPWAASVVSRGSSLFLPPAVAHGLWLEFREGDENGMQPDFDD